MYISSNQVCFFAICGILFKKKTFPRGETMNNNLKLEETNFQEKYGVEAILTPENFLAKMNFLKDGLTSEFAKSLLIKNGPNELKQAKEKKWYHYFRESLFPK